VNWVSLGSPLGVWSNSALQFNVAWSGDARCDSGSSATKLLFRLDGGGEAHFNIEMGSSDVSIHCATPAHCEQSGGYPFYRFSVS
jgi:hypothetical protein